MIALTFDTWSNLESLDKLKENGFKSRGRFEIWIDYITSTLKSGFNILFGTYGYDVKEMVQYEGNIHNSILNVHMYNGIFVFIGFIIISIKSIIIGLKNKQIMSVLCLLTIIVRGFTDNFLWCSFGMIILLIPLYELSGKHTTVKLKI